MRIFLGILPINCHKISVLYDIQPSFFFFSFNGFSSGDLSKSTEIHPLNSLCWYKYEHFKVHVIFALKLKNLWVFFFTSYMVLHIPIWQIKVKFWSFLYKSFLSSLFLNHKNIMDCLEKCEVYHQKAYVSVITKTLLAFIYLFIYLL